MRPAVRPALAAAALLALAWAGTEAEKPVPPSLAALDAREAAAVCAAAGIAPADFWARAQAAGVGAMALRPQTLGELSDSGQALLFSRGETAKLRGLGLVAAGSPLKGSVVWVNDAKLFVRVAGALRAERLVLSTASFSGHGLVELARDPEPAWSVGPAPEDLALAASLGLAPLSLPADGRAWSFPATARLPGLLRAAYGRPGQALLLRLDSSAPADSELQRLRGLLRPLRERGLLRAGAGAPAAPPGSPLPAGRRLLAWALAAFGPIIAVRLGVRSFQRVRVWARQRQPAASPVAEVASGALSIGAVAAGFGLTVGLLLAGAEVSAWPESLALSTMAWPLAIGALALYPLSARALSRRLSAAPTYAALLRAALLALAAALLLRPRLLLGGTPVWDLLQSAADGSRLFWWWPWRWRESLVGLPALMVAFYLVGRQRGDPRPWLWLGLLFPIGVIAALGRPAAATGLVLGQTAVVLAAGLLAGGALLAVTAALGPRAIDPQSSL